MSDNYKNFKAQNKLRARNEEKGGRMTVKELIEFLETKPQDLQVAHELYSEQYLLEAKDIDIRGCCEPRNDGWVQNERPDMPSQEYLIFPGN